MSNISMRLTGKRSLIMTIALHFAVWWAGALGAQETGSIRGTITSLHGDAVPAVTITLVRPENGKQVMTVLSGSDGTYLFPVVAYGHYALGAAKTGFQQSATKQLDLTGTTLIVNFSLTSDSAPVTTSPFKQEGPAGSPKKAPSFSPSGILGTTAPSGYSSGATAANTSQAMDLIVGLPFDDLLLGGIPEGDISCAAEDALLRAVHDRPASFEANHKIGLFYLQHDEPARGAQYLDVAAELAPDNAINSRELALADLATGQYAAAASLLRNLLSSQTTDAALHTMLAEAYAATGQRAMAITEYQRAADLDPSEQNIFVNGLGLLRMGAADEANAMFTASTVNYPSSAHVWLGRGVSESLQFRKERAIVSLLRAADLNSDYEPPYSFLASLYGVSPDADAKITDAIARFVAAHPNSAMAHYNYAEVLLAEGRNAPTLELTMRVESEFRSAIARDPELARAHFGLGLAYYQAKRYGEAVPELRLAVRLNPSNSEWHYHLFKAYKADKQEELAELELKKFSTLRAEEASHGDGTEIAVQDFDPQIFRHGIARARCHAVNQ